MTAPLHTSRCVPARGFLLLALICVLTIGLLASGRAAHAGPPDGERVRDRIAQATGRSDPLPPALHGDHALLDGEEPPEQAARSSAELSLSRPVPVAGGFRVAADARPERVAVPRPERPPRA